MKTRNSFEIILAISMVSCFSFLISCGRQQEKSQEEHIEKDKSAITHYKIGVARWVTNEEYDRNIQGFKDCLAEAGLIEGKNVEYIIGNPELNFEKQRKIIREFVGEKVNLIYSLTTPSTLEAKKITLDIPIVFSIVTYPVEANVIESLSSSNNNCVGTRNWIHISKQLELLMKVCPNLKTIGFVHRKREPNSTIQFNNMVKEGKRWGLTIIEIAPVKVSEAEEFCKRYVDKVDAFYMANDTLIQGGGEEFVIKIANQHKKMTLSGNKSGVLKGGLVGDIADFYSIGYIAGEKAVSILLHGKKPTNLVTETQRGSFVLVNLKTAKHLGIKVPEEILSIAKVVIKD